MGKLLNSILRNQGLPFIALFGLFSINTIQFTHAQDAFITTWKTDNSGVSNTTSIVIPTKLGSVYAYDIDWDNDGVYEEFGITEDASHDFGTPGTYTIRIKGDFPRIYFDKDEGGTDKLKLIDIVQWGDIQWNSMGAAFKGCANLNISATDAPDLANVTSFVQIFSGCTSLNAPIGYWNVATVENYYQAFSWCENFDQPLNNWDMRTAQNLDRMFLGCSNFNQPLDDWQLDNLENLAATFYKCTKFNQDISGWNTSKVWTMGHMFNQATAFDQNIGGWDVSNVKSMAGMFKEAKAFNQDLSAWEVGQVTNMGFMFSQATKFNQNLGTWDVAQVTKMEGMFSSSAFNYAIGDWDVSNVTVMSRMFFGATAFNQDLGDWEVGKVTSMNNMFAGAITFNQDLSRWNVANVTNMNAMFLNTPFDQNLGNWDVGKVEDMTFMFTRSTLSIDNYDAILIGWSGKDLQENVNFDAGYSIYCKGWEARQELVNTLGWTIQDGGAEKDAPVALCKDITITLNPDGTYNFSPEEIDNGSFDGCTPLSFQSAISQLDCDDIGTNLHPISITDQNGNTSTCTVSITVVEAPFAIQCPENVVTKVNNLACTAQVFWDTPLVNCSAMVSATHLSGDTFPVGITTVEYEAENLSGVIISCSFQVEVINDLQIKEVQLQNPSCHEAQDGAIALTVGGGSIPYLYDWDMDGVGDADDFEDVSTLAAGTHALLVKDAFGCAVSMSQQLEAPEPLKVALEYEIPLHQEGVNVEMIVEGGTVPYQFKWWNGAESSSIVVAEAGQYSASVVDDNGCTETVEVLIEEYTNLCPSMRLSVYPNPNSGVFNLDLNACTEKALVEVFDLNGKNILSFLQQNLGQPVDLSHLPGATYVLRVSNQYQSAYTKVVLKN